jgi:hypothetical protein
MRFLVLLMSFFFTMTAYAGFQAFDGTTDMDVFNKLQCGAGLTCSKVGDKFVLSPGLQEQVASTTTTLTAAQCGSTIVSNSADVVTLPEASTVLGCRFTFVCGTADDFDVNPADGTDTILPGATLTPSAGDAIRCTDIGSNMMLEAVGADSWAFLGFMGTITDVN